jgi:hypothetical protein
VYKDAPAPGGTYTQTTVGSGWVCPVAIAVDGAGNVYVFDGPAGGNYAATTIYKLTLAGGVYTKSQAVNGFTNGTGLAVDGAGDLYAVDLLANGGNAIDKETLANGAYAQSSIGSGWNDVGGIAVDGAGNVYVANQPSGLVPTVTIEAPGSGGYTQKTTTIGNSFTGLNAVAVDGTGNLYVLDYESSFDVSYPSHVYRETPNGSGYTQTALGSAWAAPYALSVDASGDVLVLDNDGAFEIYVGATTPTTTAVTANPTNPSWGQDVVVTATVTATGGTTPATGSVVFNDGTSNVATVALSSTGTASWTAPGNTYGPYGGTNSSWYFTAIYSGNQTFGASASGVSVAWSFPQCPITFSPAAGTYTGSVTVTANAGPCTILGQESANNPSQETFVVSSTQTISVTAGANGYDNTTATATYTIVASLPASGTIATVAGNGTPGFSGDSGAATSAELSRPFGVASDSAGNLYIADTFNSRIRKVTPSGTITTFAGTGVAGSSGDGGAAASAKINNPQTLAFDAAGNLYIADPPTNKVRKITPAGIISTYAGTGVAGHSGDSGAATSAQLNYPAGVAVDASGNVYIAEANNEDIRKVTPSGTITTIAGNGTRGYAGDGGLATSAEFQQPGGLAVDSLGNVYVADQSNNRIRRITPVGTISTVAGNGNTGSTGDGGAATSAELNAPLGVALDNAGNLYIADLSNSRVRKVNAQGTISTLAGTGAQGFSGDGGPAASAVLNDPFGLGVDASGNVYIADTYNNRIRKVTETSTVATPAATPVFSPVAGTYTSAQTVTITDTTAGATIYYTTNGTAPTTGSTKYTGAITVSATETIEAIAVATGYTNSAVATAAYTITPPAATPVFSPVAGTYTSAQTVTITDTTAGATIYYTTNGSAPTTGSSKYTGPITVSATETIEAIAVATGYTSSAVATSAYTISAATAPGTITTVAGNGTEGYTGNGGAAISAELDAPAGVSTDASGNFYIADYASNTIRKVTVATGILATVAGSDSQGYAGDGGPATGAKFYGPQYGAEDAAGNIYIADQVNCRIRKVTVATGILSTVAGNGVCGFSGDGGAATNAALFDPYGVAVDASGNLYIADTYNHRIRKVNASGTISTIAGNGVGGYNGDNMAATSAELHYPWGVSVDASGNLYIADWYNERVRKVTAAGTITTLAGTGTAGFSGDGGAATSALLNSPEGVWADAAGNVYLADTSNQRIRKVNAAGVISTVAGDGTKGFSGDSGTATAAALNTPQSVASDASGNLYIADIGNNRIRKVSVGSATATAATPVFSPAAGTYTSTQTVTIADATSGATIYYTTNGTAPTTASTKYTGAITVSATETLEAIAVATNYSSSAVATAAYTITPPAATPTFSLPGGTYTGALSVTLADATPGATIYYTTNGTAPTTSSTKYTGALSIPATPGLTETIEAIAIATNYSSSAVATAAYSILPPAATPAISPVSGTYPTAQTVTITDATPGATLYYTTNGSVPTTSSTKYTGPITVSASETIEAKAVATGYSLSSPAVATYTIAPPAATPVFSPAGGSYTSAQTVTITDATSGATIYYTTNGTAPTSSSTRYTGPITVGVTETLEAIAVASGDTNSAVATAAYTIILPVSSGTITTVAGNGTYGYTGNGGAATGAEVAAPDGVGTDAAGNFYIADTYNAVVRKVTPAGVISVVAGNGTTGYSGDGGLATSAELNYPTGVAVDSSGNLYFSDANNNRIRKVSASGTISTVAGNGIAGYSGDGGPATGAELKNPAGVALDARGNLYIADWNNNVVRKVTTAGTISTVAGTGARGFSGDGGPATSAELDYPYGVVVDAAGDLYIADSTNFRVRKVTAAGVISTVAGTGTNSFSGDGGPGASAGVSYVNSVALDPSGNLFIADSGNSRVRVLLPNGTIATAVGTGVAGYSGDGGPALGAKLHGENGLAFDSSGNLLIADTQNSAIRKVTFGAAITPILSPGGGTYTTAQTVTMTDATTGATVYYTTDGSTPTTSSPMYTGPITVSASGVVKAIAAGSGFSASPVASAAFTIEVPAATPVFSPAGGTYTSIQTVTIADTTPGATIYYTTNGTTPTTSSTKYTGPITVGQTETLAAIAVAPGYTNSGGATAAYTITLPTATPTISPAGGSYTSIQTVTIADATAGATIYYTTNGTTPTTGSTRYTGPITVGATETLKAIATAPGYSTSAVATAAYTITLTAASPTFSAPSGTYESVQTVTLATTTPGAVMYYTTNGTAPTTASTQYTGPVTVSASETIEALAVASGYINSPVASASYTIAGSPTALAESATAVTSTGATLNALVNLEGLTGSYYFAYGTSSTSLTSSTATVSLSQSGTVPVSAALTGLTAGTTYYFKVVVTTAGGSASGATLSF